MISTAAPCYLYKLKHYEGDQLSNKIPGFCTGTRLDRNSALLGVRDKGYLWTTNAPVLCVLAEISGLSSFARLSL